MKKINLIHKIEDKGKAFVGMFHVQYNCQAYIELGNYSAMLINTIMKYAIYNIFPDVECTP